MNSLYLLWQSILLVLLLVSGILTPSSASGEDVQSGSFSSLPTVVILENCYKMVFKEAKYYESYGKKVSTWKYYIRELDCAQDLSNWVLALPGCKVRGASPEPWEFVNPDPNAQLTGIKWQTGAGFERGVFTVKLKGWPPIGVTDVAAKGPDLAYGEIVGPVCQ